MPETDPNQFDEPDDLTTDDGPDVEDLEDDPAYDPDDEELKQIKGG